MDYAIHYCSEEVQKDVLTLPSTLAGRYFSLAHRLRQYGPNLATPHTKAFGDGLFELRLKGEEGITRVFFCTLAAKQIVMPHCFIKKTGKTPTHELLIAKARQQQIRKKESR
jgi:phage-related protein